jgi:hypothetical protein
VSFTSRKPYVVQTGNRYCIKHRELVAEINGSVAYAIQQKFTINPGFDSSFPWLAPIANQWEQYHFMDLSYHYIGRCPTTFAGSIMLVPEYDILDPDPASKIEASTYIGAIEQSPWTNFTCRLNTRALHPMGPKKYIRSGPVIGDLKTYDGGKLLVIAQGQDDTKVCGDIWVEYTVELYVPQSGTNSSNGSTSSTVSMFYSNAEVIASSAILQLASTRQNPLSIVRNSGVFTPLKGTYRIELGAQMNLSSANTVTLNLLQNGVVQTFGSVEGPLGATGNVYFSDIRTFNGTDTCSVQCVNSGAGNSSFNDVSLTFTLV